MRLSPTQQKVIRGMRQGKPIHDLAMHMSTIRILLKRKLIQQTVKHGPYSLTDAGEDIQLND